MVLTYEKHFDIMILSISNRSFSMLVIKPIVDKSEQNSICEECGIEFKEALFAYKAYDNGNLLACSQFDILQEHAVIDSMRQVIGTEFDFEGMFILGRAVLNFLDLCGVETAVFNPQTEQEARLAKAIGFKDENGVLTAHLKGMFDGKCEGHCDG